MRRFNSSFLRHATVLAIVAVSFGACLDSTSNIPLGRIQVSVKDEASAGAGGIVVDLIRGTTLWASLYTSSDGSGEFRENDGGVLPDSYTVQMRLDLGGSTNYTIAANETAAKPAVVVVDQTTTVSFKVAKRSDATF